MGEVITALFLVANIVGTVFVITTGGASSIKELKEGVKESSVFELILFLLLSPVVLINLLLIFFRWKPFK